MDETHDVVIVGGGAVGSAVACYLTSDPGFDGRVLVIERDPSYAQASTTLSASSIRVQFSDPLNIRVSQYGLEVIRDFAKFAATDRPADDLAFHEAGYLYLADSAAQAEILRENHAAQRSCGAEVDLLDRDELAETFPHLNVADIELASLGRAGEGWFDSAGLLAGFRRKAMAHGAAYRTAEVVGFEMSGARINAVQLSTGERIGAGHVVNASGPRAAQTARMAGVVLPVEPRKRTVFVFDCATSPQGSARTKGGRLPLMIDPSGIWCRPEGNYFLTACVPDPDEAVAFDDFTPDYAAFEETIWPVLAARSRHFEAIKVINQWAGHYAYNVLDQNMIVGPHPEIGNFVFANGFSGHGLQQSPAVGRAVAEVIAYGRYRSLDLSPYGFERVGAGQPKFERCII